MTQQVTSVLAYAGMVVCMTALAVTRNILAYHAPLIAIQALALVLMLWARLTFGRRSFHVAANPTPGGLVKAGPYRYLRHPIYAGVFWFTAAGVADHAAPLAIALGIVLAALLAVRMRFEAGLLRKTFPEYDAYARRTRRILPFVF